MNYTESTRFSYREQIILAPPSVTIPDSFQNVQHRPALYNDLLADMQRLRGQVYLQDGAIQPHDLTVDGRHHAAADYASWHLLTLDDNGQVAGCARFHMPARSTFDQLIVSRSALARCAEWGGKLRAAVNDELAQARALYRPFVEAGGWALSEKLRHSIEAIRLALGAFATGQMLGGAIGVTTATTRHHSASILSRIGFSALRSLDVEMPMYFDPQYGCDMAILRFDSSVYSPKYSSAIGQLLQRLAFSPVLCTSASSWSGLRLHPGVYSHAEFAGVQAA